MAYISGFDRSQTALFPLSVDVVAIQNIASHAPDIKYDVVNFIYDFENDNYTCPQKVVLNTNGRWYNKDRGKSVVQVKHYKTSACSDCPVKNLCTNNKEGRLIERSQHAQYIEQNKLNIEANKELYKKRQSIVEHPYGVIKRQWGFYYIMTKQGKKRASADVGCMFIAYNLRRIMNILDQDVIKKFFKELVFLFLKILLPLNVIRLNLTKSNYWAALVKTN